VVVVNISFTNLNKTHELTVTVIVKGAYDFGLRCCQYAPPSILESLKCHF